jgi:carbamoyl-phosphate synthase large subunit
MGGRARNVRIVEKGVPRLIFKDIRAKVDLSEIREKKIHLIINTPLSRVTRENAFTIRQAAIKYKVPCLTTSQAAKALIEGLAEMRDRGFEVDSLQEIHSSKTKS